MKFLNPYENWPSLFLPQLSSSHLGLSTFQTPLTGNYMVNILDQGGVITAVPDDGGQTDVTNMNTFL